MELNELKPRSIDAVTLRQKVFTFTITHIEPYSIYTTLKAKLGVPNATPPKHSQWCYECEAPTGFVRIHDWKLYGCTIAIYPDDQQTRTANQIYEDLLPIFNKARNDQSGIIKNIAKSSTRLMLQNPYHIYFTTGSELLDLAENMPDSGQRDTLCRSAFFQFLSAFEGLLNVLYDIYLKPTIRADKEISESVITTPLDKKIQMAPVYCICFKSDQIDIDPETYERYKAIRSLRNNFIHANLTAAMKTSIITHDDMTFLLEPNQTKEHNLPLIVSNLRVEHLHFTKETIQAMKDAIIDNMHPTYRYDFAKALARDVIIISSSNNTYTIRHELT